MKHLLKKALAFTLAFVCVKTVFAVEVNQDELESTGNDSITFENFGGPYAVIETAASITGIGTSLGEVIALDVQVPATADSQGKYTLIHAIDTENKQKLSGDVLVLNASAGVDHIKNLRRILTGYLCAAYGYDVSDAETLSVFITVYNAVYRGSMDYFTEKYNDLVLQNLTRNSVGLSTVWSDWAGATQIVIPIGYVDSTISSVDTTALSDENVIEALRQEDDRGIDVREQLTDIKEREAKQAGENAKAAQKEAAENRKQGNTEQAEKAAQKSSEQQNLADRKQEEVKTEKSQIAKDAETVVVQPEVAKVTGLFIENEKKNLYRLTTFEAATGKIILKSPITQVRSRSVYTVENVTVNTEENGAVTFKEMYLAVCGVNDKKSAVRLCLIDTDKLELKKQSEEILSDSAELIEYNGDFITVVRDEKKYKLAVYTKDLTVKAKTSINVKPSTPVNITSDGILVTDASGLPVLLDKNTLSQIWSAQKTNVRKAKNEK